MEKIILIKYGELTTKKDNRNLFIKKIYDHLKIALSEYDINIIYTRDRMFIEPKEENIGIIVDIVKNIFGIHSIVIAYKVQTNIDLIKECVLSVASTEKFDTFKVQTDRSDKSFEINSGIIFSGYFRHVVVFVVQSLSRVHLFATPWSVAR